MAPFEPWFSFAELILRPPIQLWFNWRFEGLEHVPPEGPVLVAANHISYLDPLAHALMLRKAGRHPRFLAKKELYGNALVGQILRGAKQIPVDRGSRSAAPLEAAIEALRGGEAVVVYPEATLTTNEDSLPMQGKTGLARLTLETGTPVVPIAVWGPQRVWPRDGLQDVRFGRPIWVKAGAPMDFSEFDGQEDSLPVLRKVTATVMDELRRLAVDMRERYPKRWS